MNCIDRPYRRSARLLPLIALLLLFFAHVITPMQVSASDFSLGGTAQTSGVVLYDVQQNTREAASLSSVRLDAALNVNREIYLEAAYTLSPRIFPAAFVLHESGFTGEGTNTHNTYQAWNIPEQVISFSDGDTGDALNIEVNQDVDRLFASVVLPLGDLYIGRQAISWGSARSISPTSIFSTFNSAGGLQSEKQRGIDALRLRIPFGMMGEIDTGYVFGENFRYTESAAFVRVRTYVQQTDLTFLIADAQEHLLAGGNAVRSIGGVGTWIEAAYILPDTFNSNGFIDIPDSSLDFSRQQAAVTIGMDYTFSPKLYGFTEYHFNSAGKKTPEEYVELYLEPDEHPAYRDGLIQLAGRHYAVLGGTYQLHPLLPVHFSALVNVGDPSAAVSLEMEYSLAQNLTFTLGGATNLGGNPERNPDGTISTLHSEFGANPQMLYFSADLYY